jgi:DNA helicase-2/ATP-dependent DNA helicase PcrA
MDQQEIKRLEEQHLAEVVAKVKNARDTLKTRLTTIGKDNLERLADLKSDPETGTDFQMLLDQLHEKNESYGLKEKIQRLEEYEFLTNNPYFARIDLKEGDDAPEQLYIGKFGYTERSPVVTDWRASVASVYYRYRFPQKNVEYKVVDGVEKRELLLKRTFDIHQGQLVKLYNNDIQFDEKDIVIDKIKTRTGGVLEDIIETIQQDQMDIIEADPRQICIVQGCVGSGKSTVAIHKLAHIFFHFSNYIHPEKSILIVKNQILVGYLATLFPKLGIFDIKFKTLRDLIVNAIFREELPIKFDLDVDQNTDDYDLRKITHILKSIESTHFTYENKIKQIFEKPDFAPFGGFKYSTNLTPFENVNELFDDLSEEIETQKEALKENPGSMRAMIFRDNIQTLRAIIRKINDLKSKLKEETINEFLKEFNINPNSKLSYLHTLIYVFIYGKLIGFKKIQPYEYCVIDEGQDFSLLEFAVLNNFVLRGRFGIFGDLNQGLNSDGIKQWTDIKDVIPEARTANLFKLETNFRSTKPIIELANNVLGKYTSDYLPKSVNRNGEDPEIALLDTKDEVVSAFSSLIKEDIDNLSKSIGIICYDADYLTEAEKIIKNSNMDQSLYVKLDQTKRISYVPKGVYLMSIDDCKGLEFSKIYILGLNLGKIKSADAARHAFVAVTRAMNELVVLGTK